VLLAANLIYYRHHLAAAEPAAFGLLAMANP
jgi:hypothetical protein